MTRFLIESYFYLIRIELLLRRGHLRRIHDLVRRYGTRPRTAKGALSAADLCRAMDIACVLYPKQVLCLQRSAAATLLLRSHGFRVEMVIGAQTLPFKSHAWVELDNTVITDKPYMHDIYQVLERC